MYIHILCITNVKRAKEKRLRQNKKENKLNQKSSKSESNLKAVCASIQCRTGFDSDLISFKHGWK